MKDTAASQFIYRGRRSRMRDAWIRRAWPCRSAMLSQLRQRITPSQLGMGEETEPRVISLLEHLARPWSQSAFVASLPALCDRGVRTGRRRFRSHAFLRDRQNSPAGHAATYSTGIRQLLPSATVPTRPGLEHQTAGQFRSTGGASSTIPPGFPPWRSCRQRLQHGQLIVVLPHDGEIFPLAEATWLMQEESAAGGRSCPAGHAARDRRAVANVQVTALCAFMLPAVPAIGEEASIVIPVGLYQASRVLDFFRR